MDTDIRRRTVICPCGGDVYERTWDYSDAAPVKGAPIWKCENCFAKTPRKSAPRRRTNEHRAIDAYLALRQAWAATDAALDALANDGVIKGGALLVHSSVHNWHLKKLSDTKRPSNWDIKYNVSEAREALEKARQFVFQQSKGVHGRDVIPPATVLLTGKVSRVVRIRQNVWGNWYGYVGGRRVAEFGKSSTETAEQAAQRWLQDAQKAGVV